VARTYFVDPSKQQEEQYAAIVEAQAAAIAALVEGAPMSAAYEAVVGVLKVCPCTPSICVLNIVLLGNFQHVRTCDCLADNKCH
jgi:nucleosome binding factor SPN SPT16 subunit